jgi:hypothetical protein
MFLRSISKKIYFPLNAIIRVQVMMEISKKLVGNTSNAWGYFQCFGSNSVLDPDPKGFKRSPRRILI